MQRKQLSRAETEVIGNNNGLSLYLENLQSGRQSTPHSWLYEREDAFKTLDRWLPLMEQGNSKSPFATEFNIFDRSQIKKFGPQGAIPPFESDEVREVLEPLYSPTEFDDPLKLQHWFAKADEFGHEVFSTVLREHPLPYRLVVDDMRIRDSLNTNSGYPRFTRRNLVRGEEVKDAESGAAYHYSAIILFRFYYGKLRPVWMYPMSRNLREMRWQQPIQRALQNSPLPWVRAYLKPWEGYEFVKAELTKQWTGQQIIGGDTTKMDAHMRPAQLRLFYEIVKWLFQPAYWNELWQDIYQVNTIPLIVSDKYKLEGIHGLASGSAWTQLSETTLQLFMAWNARVYGQGIGDDFYWLSNMSAGELVKYLGKFGLPANAEKQSVGTEHLTFLQRMNHQGFFSRDDRTVLGGYYPTVRALCSLLLPEKFHKAKQWNSDMFCARTYMVLENCVDDPCFDEFLSFVVRGQKDLIPFAKYSAAHLNSVMRKARQVQGLFPSYNQEKLGKPLAAFTSIQLASKL